MNLGKFRIFEEVGHGGFGTVYRANDITLDRIVALKILHQEYLSDQKFIESFKREARMMAKVSHPNVVQIFEVGDLKGQIYIAMQYFDGGNLDQKIQAGGPLPLKDAIRMLNQTARGLEAGHKIGLVHRDVKPANILYNREGYIAISDFGVAKSIQQSSPETTNSFNQFAGTPYYIPPELWKSEGNPSPAADVYSLACVFYEALTGEVLFAGETYEHVLTRHVLEAPVFSTAFPESLVETLTIALAKNPSDRYQTMNDFLAAVRGALERQPRKSAVSRTPPEQSSVIEELPKPLSPGKITFDELVRRSQRKSSPQSPITKPTPISQPTPAPIKLTIPTAQPQQQKTEPEPESKPEAPAVLPIIHPPKKSEPLPGPNAEDKPSPEALETKPEVRLPEIEAEHNGGSVNEGLSDEGSAEDFFAQTSDAPLETNDLGLLEARETSPTENLDDSLIFENWLTKESVEEQPALAESSVSDEAEEASVVEPPLVAGQESADGDDFADKKNAETQSDSELINPVEQGLTDIFVETQLEEDQSEPAPEPLTVPTQTTQARLEKGKDAEPDVALEEGAIAAASTSQIAMRERKPEDQVVLETISELPRAEQNFTSPDVKPAQILKEREGLLAHNAATNKFDQSQKTEAASGLKRNSKFVLMLAVGGIAVIALAFLVFSGQAGSWFGGKPSGTPTFTLTPLPGNTAAAPVILPNRTNTSTIAAGYISTNAQVSATATLHSPTRTATATATPYPTARPTDRPTNPLVVTTAPPVVSTAPPTAIIVPPTIAPPTATIAPPTVSPPTTTAAPPNITIPPTRAPTPTPS